MGRCRSLGSLKSFLWYIPHLSGASILCFTSWLSSRLTLEQDCGLMAARWQVFFPSQVPLGLSIDGGCNHWWLWDPLFTDMAGNILLLNSIRWMYHNLFIYSPTNDHSGCLWFWLLQIKRLQICIVKKIIYHLCAYIIRENGNELVNSLKASSCSDSNFLNHWSFPHNISSMPWRVVIF